MLAVPNDQHRPSSELQRLDGPQLRSIQRLAELTIRKDLSLQHPTSSCTQRLDLRQRPSSNAQLRTHTTATDIYIHACKYDEDKVSFVNHYLTFVQYCFGTVLIHINVICGVDIVIGSATGEYFSFDYLVLSKCFRVH